MAPAGAVVSAVGADVGWTGVAGSANAATGGSTINAAATRIAEICRGMRMTLAFRSR